MASKPSQSALWASFIPYLVARDLAGDPERELIGREERLHAVVLFADISGFTAISELLATRGRSGAETLTGILNAYFQPIIALVESYGGIITGFGGDALTAIFPMSARSTVLPAAPWPVHSRSSVMSRATRRCSSKPGSLPFRSESVWLQAICYVRSSAILPCGWNR
jgi:class 3 adenylate cyclase